MTSTSSIDRRSAAAVGVLATGAAVATGELLAGLLRGLPSPIIAIGQLVIDLQPAGAKDVVVQLFGTNDKPALEVLVLGVALAIGAGLGILARTRHAVAFWIFSGFVGVGFFAGLQDPETQPTLALAGAAAELFVGSTLLERLLRVAAGRAARRAAPAPGSAAMPDWSRRSLLRTGATVAVASVAAGAFGRSLLGRQRAPITGTVPTAELPATLPSGADLGVPDVTPIVVDNKAFYRIDTALLAPNVDRDAWQLKVTGMVDKEVTLTYDQLVALPIIEQYVTIACVSNGVGGDLVGNAKWTGVRLRDVLDMAGVQDGATQLVGRSVDGFTAGMPTAWVMDPEREPMIAVGMNGAPLPQEHGYPARLIVPGLYGYVSATKWLSELELTTLEAFDAYWVPLGWAKEAPILTQSRVDRPQRGAMLDPGPYVFGGVAWAPDRGVSKVEVQVDDGEWREATLSNPISDATWVQWKLDWTATSGDHLVRVRATDGAGETQSGSPTPAAPDGARGWHYVTFSVR